jgi:hypothetical protein
MLFLLLLYILSRLFTFLDVPGRARGCLSATPLAALTRLLLFYQGLQHLAEHIEVSGDPVALSDGEDDALEMFCVSLVQKYVPEAL